MSQTENIRVAGVSIEVWRAGEGRPLLYLHSGEGVEPALSFLQSLSSRYQVIAPSHPGFGGSDLPDHFSSVDDLAYFYLDLVKQLGLEGALLMGSSFGGWIAASMAIKNSGLFSGLVLASPLGAKFGDESTREIADLFSVPQYNLSQVIYADQRKIDYSEWEEKDLVRLARNHRSFALFGWSPTLHDPKLSRRLYRIDLPTLVVWGDRDNVVKPAYGRHYADAISGARFVLIEGAGHYPHVEAQARFEEELASFSDKLPMFAGACPKREGAA
ncbi:alpha/beta fold hydrolase [Sphingosinicella soli]|uniref:Pimeloyl-ACP methyl ester carboxylesterase n=1 Tax=Sphingosinicella soli TaxID=333708 RepID=A0A7W7B2A7_9SPHN|nr:alpha/beta hydrolase [Sphingosinicella soli]MBB4632679.1 pimeloyl-ACP methyl ester carboxylesterase [Sphingosinicella soli]